MKIALFYELANGRLPTVLLHYTEYRARLDEFKSRGVLLMAGPLGSPPKGAMGIFTTREAAEEFVQGDPLIKHGAVDKWRIIEWNEILG